MSSALSSVAGIVLAGGASSRMGRDKALLPWRDGNLLEHMQGLLCTVCDQVFVSGKQQGIVDQQRFGGPVLAIASVFADPASRRFDTLLFCAVDTPFLTTQTLQSLLWELSSESSSPPPLKVELRDAAHFDQHFLPLVLRNSEAVRCAVASIAGSDSASGRSLHRLCAAMATKVLPVADTQQFLNLNTAMLYEAHKPVSKDP